MGWAPEPGQIDGPIGLPAADEFTGAVWCPQRRSSIAIMRCGEYQARDGCGIGCSQAASEEQLAELAAAVSGAAEDEDRDSSSTDFSENLEGGQGMSKPAVIEELLKAREPYAREIDRAYGTIERIQPILDHVDGTIALLGGRVPEQGEGNKNPAKAKPIGERLLKRRAEFAAGSTGDAVLRLLDEAAEPMSRKDLAEKIFEVETGRDFARAMASLGSELSAGARRGRWLAVGGGHYQAKLRNENERGG